MESHKDRGGLPGCVIVPINHSPTRQKSLSLGGVGRETQVVHGILKAIGQPLLIGLMSSIHKRRKGAIPVRRIA